MTCMNAESCRKSLKEWHINVTNSAIEKNWRKLWFTMDGAYTVLHICSDTDELGYRMLVDHVLLTLAKLMFGYIYTDRVLYGEYLMRLFRNNEIPPIDIIDKIHQLANNNKEEITVDDIKQYTVKLISSIINYIYTPY